MIVSVQIRKAALGDAAIVEGFNAQLAFETEGVALTRPQLHEGVEAVLADPTRGIYWLAEVNRQVVGQLLITREWSDWRNGWMIWLQSVYVASEKRGAGVFRLLFERSVELARLRCDAVCIRLYVEHENEAATATYRRLGFRDSGYLVMEMPLES